MTEEVYRERWNQIDKDEKEEFRFIKIDTIEKLSFNKILFFDPFDSFLRSNFSDIVFKPEDFKDLQEMEKLHREKQLWVLEKLLNFSFFQKMDICSTELEKERPVLEHMKSANSEILDRDSDPFRNANDFDREALKTQINDTEYFGREKKLMNVKLTKYLSIQTDFSQTEKKNIGLMNSLPQEKLFRLTEEDISKILKAKKQKSYYNEEDLVTQFDEIKNALLQINKKIDENHGMNASNLTDQEIDMFMKACSFSMNSVHFMQKFEKSNYYIGPGDIWFILNKLK